MHKLIIVVLFFIACSPALCLDNLEVASTCVFKFNESPNILYITQAEMTELLALLPFAKEYAIWKEWQDNKKLIYDTYYKKVFDMLCKDYRIRREVAEEFNISEHTVAVYCISVETLAEEDATKFCDRIIEIRYGPCPKAPWKEAK